MTASIVPFVPGSGNPTQKYGGGTRSRTEVHGFAIRCIATLPFRRVICGLPLAINPSQAHNQKNPDRRIEVLQAGAIPLPCDRLATKKKWSGKRDSNSRPQPWQGCALPTELFPPALQGDVLYRRGLRCQASTTRLYCPSHHFPATRARRHEYRSPWTTG